MLRRILCFGVPLPLTLLVIFALVHDRDRVPPPATPVLTPGVTCEDTVTATAVASGCTDAHGNRHGRYVIRARKGDQLYQEREYRAGRPHGRWTLWSDGRIKLAAEFEDGRLVTVDGARVKRELALRAADRMQQIYAAEAKPLGVKPDAATSF